MIQAPQIEPVSNLIRNYLAIFAKLKNGPVFLAQRSKPAAVLVSLEEWTETANRLAQLEGLLASKRVVAAIDRGEMTTIKHDDLVKLLAEKQANASSGKLNIALRLETTSSTAALIPAIYWAKSNAYVIRRMACQQRITPRLRAMSFGACCATGSFM